MSSESLDHVFKILLIGDAGVGKSSILLQFTDGLFNEAQQSTIGVDFKVKIVDAMDSNGRPKRVKVTIWDTAGQERFRTLTSSYYRGAQGIVLVYDVARQETFDSLDQWLSEVDQYSTGEVVKLLVGNKVDQERVVEREFANEWARSRGMLFLEASAKTKDGIAQVFSELVMKILGTPDILFSTRPVRRSVIESPTKSSSNGSGGSSGGCC